MSNVGFDRDAAIAQDLAQSGLVALSPSITSIAPPELDSLAPVKAPDTDIAGVGSRMLDQAISFPPEPPSHVDLPLSYMVVPDPGTGPGVEWTSSLDMHAQETAIDAGERMAAGGELSMDALERASEAAIAGNVDIGSVERCIDSVERHLDKIQETNELRTDAREMLMGQVDIMYLILERLGIALSGKGKGLSNKDAPSLQPSEWKGGQAFFPVDPATDTRVAAAKSKIFDQKERIEKFQQLLEKREAENDPGERVQEVKVGGEIDANLRRMSQPRQVPA
ncbi:MAG: hypothetical protein LBP65_02805 [Puniceicoccales bacterium]|nr:hypothetical protein [Puniceicoccales bacterium]